MNEIAGGFSALGLIGSTVYVIANVDRLEYQRANGERISVALFWASLVNIVVSACNVVWMAVIAYR